MENDALAGLCSSQQLTLLDTIDHLRFQGISHYVSLPQIIVCGDQSSGKSSVLEALSGVSFPVQSSLCTRFPTELVLRKTTAAAGVEPGIKVSIVPDPERSRDERHALETFHQRLDSLTDMTELVNRASEAMGISTFGRSFCKDLLRIELSGPAMPQLTIVDLPGLVHSATKNQTETDVAIVKQIVQTYMREPRSVILAVISAKNDYANQIVLKLAREADRTGTRTLGIITKPDTLEAGSTSENQFVYLAQNRDVSLGLGWHVLKNMDSDKGAFSLQDRNAIEAGFFAGRAWNTALLPSHLGIDNLRKRLNQVLVGQISTELPSLVDEIEDRVDNCRCRLAKLGSPRATLEQQQSYLFSISQLFQNIVKAAIDGSYNDPFFGDAHTKAGYQKRIRAVSQNHYSDFSDDMITRGHRYSIGDETNVPRGVTAIKRDEYIERVNHLMKRTRGRELPGTYNPMIVMDLFREQSIHWQAIAHEHIEQLRKPVDDFIILAAKHTSDKTAFSSLYEKLLRPALGGLFYELKQKTDELLEPLTVGHPMTYSRDFPRTLQETRNNRRRQDVEKIIETFLCTNIAENVYLRGDCNTELLARKLVGLDTADVTTLACSEAVDCMQAYYQIALERFIDNVCIEAIESKLISKLDTLFCPAKVITMSAEFVDAVAGETRESRASRQHANRQLEVLSKGAEACKRFLAERPPVVDPLVGIDRPLSPVECGTPVDETYSDVVSESDDDARESSICISVSRIEGEDRPEAPYAFPPSESGKENTEGDGSMNTSNYKGRSKKDKKNKKKNLFSSHQYGES